MKITLTPKILQILIAGGQFMVESAEYQYILELEIGKETDLLDAIVNGLVDRQQYLREKNQ